MTSKKDQLKNIINLVKIAESNEDAMDIDQDTEFDKHLTLYHKILNSEINYNKIPKSYDWVQNCLFNYRDKDFLAIQLAVVLYRLGSNASLWTIATLFGKCEQTILNFLDRLIIAIRSLKDEYIVWPQENYRKEVHEGFENFGFPMVPNWSN
ncbi:hypothetical protein C2G38_2192460 [Gigaspora rosea]|uniref:Uncharacterized protein n=1 Tax=Gigaspora rosea TaxID=44941 RepID=A0A397V0G7_9GLOM|nr:hypothetical protein C2G38_2192460 [Gigaspora rosea]CAG8541088.1 14798_t:CDS:2 [Gigaspora rosea]